MNVKIPREKLNDEQLMIYNKPKRVYIPMISGGDTNVAVLVSMGEHVYKGSIIAKRKGDYRIPIHSSVSGTVVDFEEHTCYTGKKVKCVVIENDFKETIENKVSTKRRINQYSKEEFLEILKENGIVGLGGNGFPTYLKYDVKVKIKTLIINALECEPFISTDSFLIKTKCEELLETIDAILEINGIDQAIIAVNDLKLKEIFDNYIGTYLKIKLVMVPDVYPIGWERKLVKELTGKEYTNNPIEQRIIVNNISTIYAIYEALKYHKPLIERIITFSGVGINENKNVLVKVGTPVQEVLEKLGLKQDVSIIAGGAMMGNLCADDLVTSKNLSCVITQPYKKIKEEACIKCGRCVEVCPAKLSPVLIMKNLKKEKQLKKLEPSRCMECGLCSYICPANILVREYVKEAKEIVRRKR